MCADDFPLDQPSFRRPDSKKRLSHNVAHRYHNYYKGNGFINKMLIAENKDSDNYQQYWQDYASVQKKEKEICRASAGTEALQPGVVYSQGKKKRWQMAEELREECPEPDAVSTTTAVVELQRTRMDRGDSVNQMYVSQRNADLSEPNMIMGRDKGFVLRMKRFSLKTKNGKEFRGHGQYNPKAPIIPSTGDLDGNIHIQYQILDYKTNKKFHNTHFFPRSAMTKGVSAPLDEGCRIRHDVVRDSTGEWLTGERERPALKSEEEMIEWEDEGEETKRLGLTLGDFISEEGFGRRRIRVKKSRCLSENWDVVE